MKRGVALVCLGVLLLLILVALLASSGSMAGPSTLSAGPQGWSAAKQYLELSGSRVELLDQPLEESLMRMRREAQGRALEERATEEYQESIEPVVDKLLLRAGLEEETPSTAGILVVSFPRRGDYDYEELYQLERFVRDGGTLVAAYSGATVDFEEWVFFQYFGIRLEEIRQEEAPLGPFEWRRWKQSQWRLQPAAGSSGPGLRPVAMPIPLRAPWPEEPDQVLMEAREELPALPGQGPELGELALPAVTVLHLERGRLVLLPSALWTNAYLFRGGAADLLETLRQGLQGPWYFDEYGHGLRVAEPGAAPISFASLRLFAFHVLLLYGLAVWVLSRRFGEAWREPRLRTGSAASFLLGLAGFHRRSRHHGEAARLLVDRVAELEPAHPLPDELRRRALVAEQKDWLPLAQAVARSRPHGSAKLTSEDAAAGDSTGSSSPSAVPSKGAASR
ncbi:MAG: hypothetical protein AAGD01_16895 [Acidobacteriota bacterium]